MCWEVAVWKNKSMKKKHTAEVFGFSGSKCMQMNQFLMG